MKRRKSIIGALALCALSIFAFGAANASAAGLTAVKCVKLGPAHVYKSSHCTTPGEGGEYETVAIAETTNVEGRATTFKHELGSTNNPVAILHGIVGGVEVTITCGKSTVTGGDLLNTEEGGEMKIHGTKGVTHYEECHAHPKTKPEKICTVQNTGAGGEPGKITTNPLTTTTGPEHKVTITPETGEVFVEFQINASGGTCFTGSTLPVKVTGKATGKVDTETHSHLTLNEETEKAGLLKANGGAASYTSTVQFWMEGNEEETVGAETF
jgi:hypothetical protein